MSHRGSGLVNNCYSSGLFCVRAAKLDQPTSRIDFCGSPSFPVEIKIIKLPIAEKTRICLDLPYYIKFGLSTFLLLTGF